MSEPPGAQPALGIDSVEWLATGERTVTVIVTGRWRRRASWRGRAMLVIEAHGHHHRFRAIPEPPSIAGATPGTWRMSFSIPAELAPHLGGQAWLQLGAVVVPLPGVVEPGAPEEEHVEPTAPAAQTPEVDVAAEEATELPPEQQEPVRAGEEHARQRLENVIAAVSQLSERIQHLEDERRAAEQRANEEHARRLQLEEQHADLHQQLAAGQRRIHDLERQLAEARASTWRSQVAAEIAVARHSPRAIIAHRSVDESAADRARAQLDRERAVIASVEADHSASLERELRDQALRAERLYEVIDELRAVLDAIRGVGDAEVAPAVEPDRLDAALAKLRVEIPAPEQEITPASPPASEATASEVDVSSRVEPVIELLAEAVTTPVAPTTRKSWLIRLLREMAKDDPVAAGRVVLGLLPAERLVYAEDVAYDLVLSELGCVQVTARRAATQVWKAPGPRSSLEVNFRLSGSLETFARFVLAGRLRRRFGRRMASFAGDRKRLPALTSLVRTSLGLKELYAGGMRLDPQLTFTLVAAMIDPKAADGHRFTIGHRGPDRPWYLRISGRERPVVTDAAPLGPVSTTIVSEPGALLGVLAGEDLPDAVVRGAGEPLALLRDWVLRAQSG